MKTGRLVFNGWTLLAAVVARSLSKVAKLWTGSLCSVWTFCSALSERNAGVTGLVRCASAPWWSLCSAKPIGTGTRQAGDVRLSRLHAHLLEGEKRGLLAPAHHHCEAAAGEAEAGEVSAHATPASAHPRAGTVVGERGAGTSRLLRRARQPPGRQRLPQRAQQALAACASAPQPATIG